MAKDLTYTGLEQLLHRIAFGVPGLQATASDIEDILFRRTIRPSEVNRPIFITSLPRAGTTVLLEALYRLPGMATHLYRDMPFVLAPLLWSHINAPFRKGGILRERAHEDGLQIGFDSPEAFEEVLWRAFYPHHYSDDGITCWTADDNSEEFKTFFLMHMQKLITLRQPQGGRYISKNNANIARLDLIPRMFPDAAIVVPVRQPLDHAVSLLRQHENFLKRHSADPFGRRYMADIGHFEFGQLHRPIVFRNLRGLVLGRDPSRLDYWLSYWIAAFEHVLAHSETLLILSHEATRRDPRSAIARLCDALAIPERGLENAAAVFQDQPPRNCDLTPEVDEMLLNRADELYAQLDKRSLTPTCA